MLLERRRRQRAPPAMVASGCGQQIRLRVLLWLYCLRAPWQNHQRIMSKPISRSVNSPAGTTVRVNDGKLIVWRRSEAPEHFDIRTALGWRLEASLRAGDLTQLRTTLDEVANLVHAQPSVHQDLERDLAQLLPAIEAAMLPEPSDTLLGRTAPGAREAETFAQLQATQQTEAIARQARQLQQHVQMHAAVLEVDTPGDISEHMNLYVRNPLYAATQTLADSLGGQFERMHDRVARYHYAGSDTVDTANFEQTARVLLVERETRQVVSQDATGGFYRLELDGEPVYKGEAGLLRWGAEHPQAGEPVRIDGRRLEQDGERGVYLVTTDGKQRTAAPETVLRRLAATDVSERNVVPRPNSADSAIAPRSGIGFGWRGFPTGREFDVSWWGQCESSGLLGSLGVMPARHDVTLYDAEAGSEVRLSAEDITNMMVYMARGSYFDVPIARDAGEVNPSTRQLDGDKPHEFHRFVRAQIDSGLPFNVEAFSYDQIWNYPVHQASIDSVGEPRTLSRGRKAQTYVMELVKSDGETLRYTYELVRDARGEIIDSSWDLNASQRANGPGRVIPDRMKSYFSPSVRTVRLTAWSLRAQWEEWTPEALDLVADLYFASHAQPADAERVYAVRGEDGRLQRMSAEQYERYSRHLRPSWRDNLTSGV